MVHIDDWVWAEARDRSESIGGDWGASFKFVPANREAEEVRSLLQQAVQEFALGRDEERIEEVTGERADLGSWRFRCVDGGVRISVSESDIFASVLPALLQSLDRRGVEGRLCLEDELPGVRPPARAPLLKLEVCMRGTRLEQFGLYHWIVSREAREVVAEAAARWCRWDDARDAYLTEADRSIAKITPADAVATRIELHLLYTPRLFSVDGSRFRAVAFRKGSGRVSLVIGGDDEDPSWWREPVRAFTDFLREHADQLVYGSIVRGWDVCGALSPAAVSKDWPYRDHFQPQGLLHTYAAFDDEFAADAFGVQLLGPGYADRLPDGEEWNVEPLGDGRALVSHVDPAAWFSASSVEPELLERARRELGAVLFRSGGGGGV